ncbi:sulfatase-like hydrolase/transferase [Novosphingobium flavum]|uniref:Sulfatase-like hydrolase/transferase n=1 Tax=Novosphingobium flavum TaxID=1778672 RepID=A0A7X1FR21_9SPHN|nr:sulfatase-like hydrolase/transferase [Novosphingobium flavum]MBC2665405.1 sulfatase-like hydrolase/transferase [Novosphingobium flavum]
MTDRSRSGLSRRTVLSGMAGLAAAQSVAARAATARERPNILWLVSEDNNPYIGAYGDRIAHTPNIDALAKRGILYRNVYSNAPVCAPTRFTILTGVHSQSAAPANHMRANAKAFGILPTYPEEMRKAGYYCTNNAKTDYNCDVDPKRVWDDSGKAAHYKNRPAGKPFMAVFNTETTHESRMFVVTEGKVKPEDVRVPAYLPDTPEIRRDYASYYNLMERMDGEIGARLAELEAAGLADDTIVFYYSDNGGVLPRSKRYCTDEGLRCGMVVHFPPKWAHLAPASMGSAIEAPVSYVDLAPTVLSLAGAPIPAAMQGKALAGAGATGPQRYAFGMRNRMDERYDFVRTVTDGRYRYIRNYMPFLPLVQNQGFSWLMKSYQNWDELHRAGKLNAVQRRAFEPRSYEEFYDLKADPDGIDNRIADAALAPRIAAMRAALDAEMLRVNDNGFIPESSPLEGYVPSRAKGVYPLRRAMALGQAAARRDPRKLALFRASLADRNEVIRYWGALGLLMLDKAAAPAAGQLAGLMRSDPSGPVRVVAAEALAGLGRSEESVSVLAALLESGSQPIPVRLQALNALTRLGPLARPALPALRAAATVLNEYLPNAANYAIQQLEGTYDPRKPIFDYEGLMRSVGRING